MNYANLLVLKILGALPALAAGESRDRTFWLPSASSSAASEVDSAFYFFFWVSVFFTLLIVTTMVAFVILYRRRKGRKAEKTITHSLPLELTWSIIPFGIMMVAFYLGVKSYINMTTPPENAYEIIVTAQKWSWVFQYPNGYADENLHVPVDRPVMLTMSSQDVIHSLYIPAFRLKRDVVPGRYTKMWFTATEPGEYELFCTEYCGQGHSAMGAVVVVHGPGEFEKWLKDAANFIDRIPPAQAGARLFKTHGCTQCHSVDGTPGIGPSLKNVFGTQQPLTTGESVLADENYMRESILNPEVKIVAGYEPVMPTFKGRLSDKQITVMIEYLKSISEEGGATEPVE